MRRALRVSGAIPSRNHRPEGPSLAHFLRASDKVRPPFRAEKKGEREVGCSTGTKSLATVMRPAGEEAVVTSTVARWVTPPDASSSFPRFLAAALPNPTKLTRNRSAPSGGGSVSGMLAVQAHRIAGRLGRPMSAEPTRISTGISAAERGRRAGEIVEDAARRRARGESLPDEAILRSHPELAAELAPKLVVLRLVEMARETPAEGR